MKYGLAQEAGHGLAQEAGHGLAQEAGYGLAQEARCESSVRFGLVRIVLIFHHKLDSFPRNAISQNFK